MHRLAAPSRIRIAALVALLIAGCGGGGEESATLPVAPVESVPSPAPEPPVEPASAPVVEVGGAVDRPASYTAADLAARPPVTQTVSYSSGSAAQTRTYTGADLWALLSDSGIQTDAARKNDVLGRYVLATGADGYRAIFSLGELNPDFGNRQNIVAYASVADGASEPLGDSEGPFRVTAPTDAKGGRYVSNLVRLEVRASAAATAGVGGGTSASFAVSGRVNTAASFDIDALKRLPVATQTVGGSVYTGVSLWTLLGSLGLQLPAGKNPSLSMYAVATGSDGYRALVSLGEVDPGFGNNGTLVAYEVDGAVLDTNGMARLVVPGELRQGRSVSNLVAIEVFAADGP